MKTDLPGPETDAPPSIEQISPYVRNAGEYAAQPDFHTAARALYDHLMEYIVEGKGQYIVDDRVYSVSPGDVILIPPRSVHSITADPADPFVRQCVHFDFVYVGGYSSMPLWEWLPGRLRRDQIHPAPAFVRQLHLPRLSHLADIPRIHSLFCRLLQEMYHKAPGYRLAMKVAMLDILLVVHRHSMELDTEALDESVTSLPGAVAHAKKHIEWHYNRKLTLADIAGVAHCHPVHLERLFRQFMDRSPIEYLLDIRIGKAQEFLRYSDSNITQVAGMAGFDSVQYFGRVFKQRVEMSPGRFREMIREHPDHDCATIGEVRDYPAHETLYHG